MFRLPFLSSYYGAGGRHELKFYIVGMEVFLEFLGVFVVKDLVGDDISTEGKELVHLCLYLYEFFC